MKHYLDLEKLSFQFSQDHGLIEITREQAESMVANDERLELVTCEVDVPVDEPAFMSVRFKAEESDTMTDSMKSVDRVYETGKAFFGALADWDDEELQGVIITDLIQDHMTLESRAQFIFQALMNGHCDKLQHEITLSRESKRFALDFAEMIGPDKAQWLYHFTKFVTKVA